MNKCAFAVLSSLYDRAFEKYASMNCRARVGDAYYLFDNDKLGYYNIDDRFEIGVNRIWFEGMEILWKD